MNHHVRIDREMKEDIEMWITFLHMDNSVFRPFVDYTKILVADELGFHSDTSGSSKIGGYGCFYDFEWCQGKWDEKFLQSCKPNIEFLALYAVTVAILLWERKLRDRRVVIFCDNMSVVHVINSTSTSCQNCLTLLRLIMLESLRCNVSFFCHHIVGKTNLLADRLSRQNLKGFREIAPPGTKSTPEKVLWPVERLWIKEQKPKQRKMPKRKLDLILIFLQAEGKYR